MSRLSRHPLHLVPALTRVRVRMYVYVHLCMGCDRGRYEDTSMPPSLSGGVQVKERCATSLGSACSAVGGSGFVPIDAGDHIGSVCHAMAGRVCVRVCMIACVNGCLHVYTCARACVRLCVLECGNVCSIRAQACVRMCACVCGTRVRSSTARVERSHTEAVGPVSTHLVDEKRAATAKPMRRRRGNIAACCKEGLLDGHQVCRHMQIHVQRNIYEHVA